MTNERRIYAHYDDDGIYVYQAFKSSIVAKALEKGTFGQGFNMERMTWIKPSFGWMLYRSGYATKTRQEAILKIKLSHEGFLTILRESVETSYNRNVYDDINEWRRDLKRSAVRHQWDPERYLTVGKHPTRRAIQIGIRGWVVEKYVNKWIIGLEDVTDLAHAIRHAKENNSTFPDVPEEQVYPVDEILVNRLDITKTDNR
ncbi:MAG: DUF4291 domain-containing protein [Chloroflexota bacterium]